MTDYNDGKWHGWNGGECPVHPESIVTILWGDEKPSVSTQAGAWREECWNHVAGFSPVAAFRVTKAYVEPPKPREFWILDDENEDAEVRVAPPKDGRKFIHVREVQE